MSASYVLEAVRTPFGRYGGGLSEVRPDDLAANASVSCCRRAPRWIRGDRRRDFRQCQPGWGGQPQRRTDGVLLAGLPTCVPGSTVNRLCGSSLDAAMHAAA